MELQCVNRCGNLTDTPDSDMCETCRDIVENVKKYKVTWQNDKIEFFKLTEFEADNLKMVAYVKSVVVLNET